jgi:ribosomal RNA methyltransferase Nop2
VRFTIYRYTEKLGVDLPIIRSRIDDLLRILGNFSTERDPNLSRKDYINLLVNDLAFYYGYNYWIIEKFLEMFPPPEAR